MQRRRDGLETERGKKLTFMSFSTLRFANLVKVRDKEDAPVFLDLVPHLMKGIGFHGGRIEREVVEDVRGELVQH